LAKIHAALQKRVKKEAITGDNRDEMLKRMTETISLEPLAPCDLIIEAVF